MPQTTLQNMSAATTSDITVRRHLKDGDADAIAELHRRVYGSEYRLNEQFVDGDEQLLGALGLTDEGDGAGRVRWLVLDPALRGRGLARSLVAELLDEARAAGLHTLTLETYSDLTAAARIYRDAGFRVQWERVHDDWGPAVTFQGYALDL